MVAGTSYLARVVYAGGLAGKSWVHNVPTDPHIVFDGEQPVLTARLWTAGYDLYHARIPVAHGGVRPAGKPWDEDSWAQLNETSVRRVRALLR